MVFSLPLVILCGMYAVIILVITFLVAQLFLKYKALHVIKWQVWFIIYCAGTALDILSTYSGLASMDVSAEINPSARFLLERMGTAEALIVHGALSALLFLILGIFLGENEEWGVLARCIIFAIAIGRFLATANNLVIA